MKKILLVEDDADLNNAYSMILKKDDYEVKSAFNGEEALSILGSFTPDLILLDLIMPVKSGLDFLKEYSTDKPKSTTVIIITNVENSEEIREAVDIADFKYVIKSHTTPQGLKKIVKSTLKRKA